MLAGAPAPPDDPTEDTPMTAIPSSPEVLEAVRALIEDDEHPTLRPAPLARPAAPLRLALQEAPPEAELPPGLILAGMVIALLTTLAAVSWFG